MPTPPAASAATGRESSHQAPARRWEIIASREHRQREPDRLQPDACREARHERGPRQPPPIVEGPWRRAPARRASAASPACRSSAGARSSRTAAMPPAAPPPRRRGQIPPPANPASDPESVGVDPSESRQRPEERGRGDDGDRGGDDRPDRQRQAPPSRADRVMTRPATRRRTTRGRARCRRDSRAGAAGGGRDRSPAGRARSSASRCLRAWARATGGGRRRYAAAMTCSGRTEADTFIQAAHPISLQIDRHVLIADRAKLRDDAVAQRRLERARHLVAANLETRERVVMAHAADAEADAPAARAPPLQSSAASRR